VSHAADHKARRADGKAGELPTFDRTLSISRKAQAQTWGQA